MALHWFISTVFPTPATTVLAVFFCVLVTTRHWLTSRGKQPFPPGPTGVPLLGFLPFLGKDFHRTLQRLAKSYGPVYQIFLGSKRVVVLSDPSLVRKAFSQAVFSGRPDTELTKLLQGYGIMNSDGALWREQRAFLHRVFREFLPRPGRAGSIKLEDKMQVHIDEFLDNLGPYEGPSSVIRRSIARAVSNILGSFLMSVTYSSRDSKFEQLLSLFEEGFRLLTLAVPVNFIPALRYVPFTNRAYKKVKNNRMQTADYFRNVADAHRDSYIDGKVRDVVDAYLVQLKDKESRDGKTTYFSEEQLIQVLMDIFSAGLETVTSTLEWAVLFLVRHPEVQEKIREELRGVVDPGRNISTNDMAHLPYTEATILEVLRRANVIALGSAHSTLSDVELAGYHIPSDTHVISNLWAIHMDPNLWDDPEAFKPERFLQDGRVHKPDYFMPFSVGRRMCLGDALTKSEMFLFLTNLVRSYSLDLPEGEELPSMDGHVAISHTAVPYKVRITPLKTPA
ncbi:cytochrome P450 18a1-like [Ornithodoros turicata]|uniref:cytochrome P450 18a1-like n=1 Tax=Ornithodoros turicata TaxID=34597 RepID=UPI0031390BAA